VQRALPYPQLANAVLLLHISIVVFVVGGLALIIAGNLRGWRWVNALWFRAVHFGAILLVASEAWFGAVCPLTSLEMWLRAQGGESTYAGGFIEHWLQRALYYDAPAWVFTVTYSLFGLIVAAIWWYFPPRYKRDA
jgi:polyferredoxin